MLQNEFHLKVGQNKNNIRYLDTKAKKSGHLM